MPNKAHRIMTKIATITLTTIISLLCLGTSHAEIYKWVDNAGNTHFSDKPTAGNNSEQINLDVIPASKSVPTFMRNKPNSAVPMSKPTPKNKSKKKVVMYSTSWCGYCKKARNYFKKKGISFVDYDVEKLPSRMREFKKLGGTGYPLIIIGGKQKMLGFSAEDFDRRYKKL